MQLLNIMPKIIVLLLLAPSLSIALYDVPDNGSECPENCRRIPWETGSDQWNNGALPAYEGVLCTGLTEGDDTIDNSAAIDKCLETIKSRQAAVLPPGTYYVNNTITIPSNKVLRGAKAAASPYLPDKDATQTTLIFGSNGRIRFGEWSDDWGSEIAILDGYTKGSTRLTMNSDHDFVPEEWIAVFEDGDDNIPTTIQGSIKGGCTWCGENNGSNLIQQYAKVTQVDDAADIITISRPLYYTYAVENNPGAKKVTWRAEFAGLENLRIDGHIREHPEFILMSSTLFCWVRGVETYNAGSGSKAAHIRIQWSHGNEIRDSYFHKGYENGSDRNYGMALFWWNSDHKFENNILRHHRHSFSFEGGGAGCAILYNYIDDNYSDDLSYLGSTRTNHGAHPMFNLWEGNIISHLVADNFWGSSSHQVIFRNWLWGDETGDGVPEYPPSAGYTAIELWNNQNYHTIVGNVLGMPSSIAFNANWENASLRPRDPSIYTGPNTPIVYAYRSAKASSTSLNHGNYDYSSNGVAFWEGGNDHSLKRSMYYDDQPSFLADYAWPLMGPDAGSIQNNNPARDRFLGVDIVDLPGAPKNLRVIE